MRCLLQTLSELCAYSDLVITAACEGVAGEAEIRTRACQASVLLTAFQGNGKAGGVEGLRKEPRSEKKKQ